MQKYIKTTIKWTILIIGAMIILLPFWMLISTSLRDRTVLFEYPPRLWPQNPTIETYIQMFSSKSNNFLVWFKNSIITAGLSTLGSLIFCSMAAYAFARKQFPGKKVLFTIILSTMMIPPVVNLYPSFLIIKNLKLFDTLAGIFLPGMASVFGMFLLRQSISTIPNALFEAARIEGCGEYSVFFRIVLPMSTSTLAVLGIWSFMTSWNSLLWPLIVAGNENTKTLTVGIATLKAAHGVVWNKIMAATVLSFLPILAVFLISRKRFIAGMTVGAVKG